MDGQVTRNHSDLRLNAVEPVEWEVVDTMLRDFLRRAAGERS
jgi:hypothetical protein